MNNLPTPEELQKKIAAVRQDTGEMSARRGRHSGAQLAINMTAELVATVATGGFLGYMVDEWIKSAPLFFIGGILLGSVAGLIAIKRINDANIAAGEKSDGVPQEMLDK
jgi:F0F1-type ATP synthase assembly protein I